MHRDVVRPQRLHLEGPGQRVGHRDEVHRNLGPVILAGLDTLGNGGVGGGPQHVHDLGPGLGRGLHLHPPGIHDLHVRHDDLAGEEAPQLPHRIEAFTLDQGGAGLHPIHPGGHRQLRHLHRPVQVHKIQRQLQYRRHVIILGIF